jgi:phytanoyl-CoA hydroxylase
MISLKTPRCLPVEVPETPAEDPSPRFSPDERTAIKEYYDTNGYVVVSGVFSSQVCDRQRELWDREVKPFDGFIYRQATARAERHVFNHNGWVMNPILNLQSVDPAHFAEFRAHATGSVLTATALRDLFRCLLGERPKIVQSMYFEGNSATWEHQDSYYLDSEKIGEMAAAWIAMEDIAATAGRFFVCPRSHLIRLDDHSLHNNVVEHHEVYITSVVDKIRQQQLQIRAPALEQGDVLFWNALTIHGSLDSQDMHRSRSSITCHAIPVSRRFLSLQSRAADVPTDELNGTHVFRPKDLAALRNRVVFQVETRCPRMFYWAKHQAVKRMIRRKAV